MSVSLTSTETATQLVTDMDQEVDQLLHRFEQTQVPEGILYNDIEGIQKYHLKLQESRQVLRNNVRLTRILRVMYRALCTKLNIQEFTLVHFTKMYLLLYERT